MPALNRNESISLLKRSLCRSYLQIKQRRQTTLCSEEAKTEKEGGLFFGVCFLFFVATFAWVAKTLQGKKAGIKNLLSQRAAQAVFISQHSLLHSHAVFHLLDSSSSIPLCQCQAAALQRAQQLLQAPWNHRGGAAAGSSQALPSASSHQNQTPAGAWGPCFASRGGTAVLRPAFLLPSSCFTH